MCIMYKPAEMLAENLLKGQKEETRLKGNLIAVYTHTLDSVMMTTLVLIWSNTRNSKVV